MASNPYLLNLEEVLRGYYENGSWRCMLLLNHVEDAVAHRYRADVMADEVVAEGYESGGQPCRAPVVTLDAGATALLVSFASASWSPATIEASHACWYRDMGDPSVDELGFINRFAETANSTDAGFTVPPCQFILAFAG